MKYLMNARDSVGEWMVPFPWHRARRVIREALGRIKAHCFPLQSSLTLAQLPMRLCFKCKALSWVIYSITGMKSRD